MSTAKAKFCTAWWTELNGGLCPDASNREIRVGRTPGAHFCELVSDHTMCRCICDATHKRPVNHAKRFEERIGRASITVDEKGVGRVMAGLTDLSGQVSAATVRFRAGKPTVIEIEMPIAAAAARGEIELDEATAKALEAAGWSGPDTELLRRRDLQEALGGLGTVLREWDDLLAVVCKVIEFNEELNKEQQTLAVLLGLESFAAPEQIQAKARELQAKAGEQP